jgi:predicted  nucleic acid-binding Zn-ribbon protein
MKASVEQQLKIVELAILDQTFDQYANQAKSHTDREVVNKLKERIEQADFELIALDASSGDLKKEISKVEVEIEQIRARADKDQQRIDSGANAKEITAMEHEIASLKARQLDVENQEILLLEQMEEIENKAKKLNTQKDSLTAELVSASDKLRRELAELKLKADSVNASRKEIAEQIDDELMKRYQKIKSEHPGLAAARLVNGACMGCNISFSPIEVQDIKANDPELIMQCDNCSCILVRA